MIKLPTDAGSVSCNYTDPEMYEIEGDGEYIEFKILPTRLDWEASFDKFWVLINFIKEGNCIKESKIKRRTEYLFSELNEIINQEAVSLRW